MEIFHQKIHHTVIRKWKFPIQSVSKVFTTFIVYNIQEMETFHIEVVETLDIKEILLLHCLWLLSSGWKFDIHEMETFQIEVVILMHEVSN